MAGGAIANHADIERFQYAEHLFADAAGFRQIVTNQRDQRETLFDFHPTQGRQFHE